VYGLSEPWPAEGLFEGVSAVTGVMLSSTGVSDRDEIAKYLHGRYIGPSEADWQLFEFPVHEEQPPVAQLAVHLPGK
jgi:hypothetical protein